MEKPIDKLRRIVKRLILQNRWTKLRQTKVADKECMVRLKEMEDHSNPDVLTFNPGGKLRHTQKFVQLKLIVCFI